MAIRKALEWAGGSFVVYVLVAACAATGQPGMNSDGGAQGGSAMNGSGSGKGIEGSGSGSKGNNGGTSIVDPVPDASAEESGTRLKVRRVTSTDGYSAPIGVWDSQLEMQCTYNMANDGKLRCMPMTWIYEATATFSDAECTKRAVVASCGQAKYASLYGAGTLGCVNGAGAYVITGYTLVPTSGYFTKSGANCTATAIPDGYTVYELGEQLPAATFAEMSFSNDE